MADEPQWDATVDPARHLIRLTLRGRFTLASWRQVLEGIPATPGLRPGMHVLVDAQVARLDFLFSDSVQLLALVKQYLGRRGGGGYRSGWVVASEVDYGVSRMVMTMLRDLPIETAVFTDLGKAEAWVVGGGPAPASADG